jgi:predicted house-cleaning noncanonical NTP pyrophosphatase (MazG superfamily)
MTPEQLEQIAARLEAVGERIAKALEHKNEMLAELMEERKQERQDGDWWKNPE